MKIQEEIGSLYKYPYISYGDYKSVPFELESTNSTNLIWSTNIDLNCKINNQEVVIIPNSIILLDQGSSFSCSSKNQSQIKVLRFNSDFFSSSLVFVCDFINTVSKIDSKNKTVLLYKNEHASFVENTFITIEHILKNSNSIDIDKLKSIISQLLHNSLKEKFKNDSSCVNHFGEILKAQYNIHHNVSDYAMQLNMKPKCLLREFQKEGLKNPSEIIKEKLLLKIKERLVYSNKSIREICFEMGFYDPAYFSRFFKKHVGVTAQYFRKQYSFDLNLIEMENSSIQ